MGLKQLENGVRQVREVTANLAKNVDRGEADFKALVTKLAGGPIEQLRDVSSASQGRLNFRRRGLLALGHELPPSQPSTNEGCYRKPQISDYLR